MLIAGVAVIAIWFARMRPSLVRAALGGMNGHVALQCIAEYWNSTKISRPMSMQARMSDGAAGGPLTSGRIASHILGRQKAARRHGVVHVFSGGRYGRKSYRKRSMGTTPTRTDQTDGSGHVGLARP